MNFIHEKSLSHDKEVKYMISAVYAGSFDPFTNGHLNIIREASKLFDEVHVLLSINSQKTRRTDSDIMKDVISQTVLQFSNVRVASHDGLVADYCKVISACYSVRGLRNTSDYLYEENIARINQEINPELKTIYLRSSNEVVSSSLVWELLMNGKSVQRYLPYDEAVLR